MATLLTSTTIPCNVISSNNIYHNSLTNTSPYISNNKTSSSFKENSNITIYPSKLRDSSLSTTEISKKIKEANNKFSSNNSLSTSNRVRCKSSSMKSIDKQKAKSVVKIDKAKAMVNSDNNDKSQCKTKKFDNKKTNTINTKKLNNATKKNINNNTNSSSTNSSIKGVNPKLKSKSNIKITSTKVLNLQNLNTQSQNPRIQTNNVTRKIINIRSPKKSSRPITKLKLPNSTKDGSNSLTLSKLSLGNSYTSPSKRDCDNNINKYFSNYSYNSEFSKKYRIKEEVGRGGYGLVFVAERISDGVEVAVKFIIKEKVPVSAWVKDPELGIIPRECYLLKHVDHPCIIKYLDCYSDRKYFYLITELHGSPWSKENTIKYYQNENDQKNNVYSSLINAAALKTNNNFHIGKVRPSMDLFECIDSYFECFDEPQARYIFVQLLSAIKYLNSLNIIHRDIKDENILIDKDLNIKLIDFGAAIQIKGGRVYDKFVGTIPYIAPEIISGQEYGSLSQDIYSLGVLLYLLIYGDLPALNNDNNSLHLPQYTIKGNYCSEEVRHLIRWMLQKSSSLRPTLDEVFSHEWIKEKIN